MKRLTIVLAFVVCPATGLAASLDGTVQRAQRVALGTPVSGIIGRIEVRPGQSVPKDALLLALKPDPFEAAVEAAQADVMRLATRRAEAQRDYKQAKELYDRTVLSTVELEDARNKATRADAEYKRAQAVLKRARIDLANTRIIAPFDAVVLSVEVQANETVLSHIEARPLVIVAARGEYLAVARATPDRATAFSIDQTATVSIAGKAYSGRVAAVALEQARGENTYRIEVRFPAAEGAVAVGQSARIEIP